MTRVNISDIYPILYSCHNKWEQTVFRYRHVVTSLEKGRLALQTCHDDMFVKKIINIYTVGCGRGIFVCMCSEKTFTCNYS